ncbi:hypothetical protein ABE28_017340 [Peribacillus muralis]|uniref:Uncharacterized protein n=1 Tax=Peribacillus muralis TaxID=264697 RepID=A0A1B3XSD7_9BACI|nr:hypothetical protein ABE28_017340 [Peribacillus muralis]
MLSPFWGVTREFGIYIEFYAGFRETQPARMVKDRIWMREPMLWNGAVKLKIKQDRLLLESIL